MKRDIYLRAHTAVVPTTAEPSRSQKSGSSGETLAGKSLSAKKHKTKTTIEPNKWPERALVFDTETRTDIHQKLMFGIYLVSYTYKNHIAGFSISPQLTGFTGPGIVR